MLYPAALIALPAQQPVSAQGKLLTLEEALALFKDKGFGLLLADAAVQSAQGDLRVNGALPPPVLSLSAGRTMGGYDAAAAGPGASSRSYSAAISDSNALSDLMWGKRRLRARASEAALEAAKLGRADAERTLLAMVKQQYAQASLAQLSLDLAEGVRISAQKTLDLVETRYKAGAVSEADVARARVGALEAGQAWDAARQSLQSSKATLSFLLGWREKAPEFQLERRFEHVDLETKLPLDRQALVAEAKQNRPDYQAAEAQERGAEISLRLARREWAPDMTWSFGVSQEGTGQNALQPRTYSLGLSMPLPSFRRIHGDISRAEAAHRIQSLQTARMEAQLVLDVDSAAAAFESALSRLDRMQAETGLLQAAKRSFDLVYFQYQKGAASLLEVMDAQRTFAGTQAEYLQTLNDYWAASFQLDQALGKERIP